MYKYIAFDMKHITPKKGFMKHSWCYCGTPSCRAGQRVVR